MKHQIICLLFVFLFCAFFGCGNFNFIYGQWEEVSNNEELSNEVLDMDEVGIYTFNTVIVFNKNGTGEWRTEFSGHAPDIIRCFEYTTNENRVKFCYEDGKSAEYGYVIERNQLTLTSKRLEMVLAKVPST